MMDVSISPPPEAEHAKAGFHFAARKWLITLATCLAAVCATIAIHETSDFDPYLADSRAFGAEFWRFFSSALAHADALHLIFNIAAVSLLGYAVETRIGAWRTLALILIFAVVSGAAQYAWDEAGIGLSGVGYGLFGLLFVQTYVTKRWPRAIGWKLTIPIVVWGIACFELDRRGIPIGNVAHVAGCIAGALIAIPMGMQPRQRRLAIIPVIAFCMLAIVAGMVRAVSDAGSHRAFEALVRAYEAVVRGDFETAKKEASAALNAGGLTAEQRADALTYRANANVNTGRVDQAGADYLGAFELDSLRKDARDNLRWWLSTRRSEDDAALDRGIDVFRRREQPSKIGAPEAFAAGWLYRLKGEWERARAMFQRAVALEPLVVEYREALQAAQPAFR